MFYSGGLADIVGDYLRRNLMPYVVSLVIFVMGVVFGAVAIHALADVRRAELARYLSAFFQEFSVEGTVSPSLVARGAILANLKTLGLIWLFAISVIGIPGVLVALFARGFVIGFTVGFLVDELGWKGIGFATVAVLPHNLLVIPALIVASASGLTFAWTVVRNRIAGARESAYYPFVASTTVSLVAVLVLAAASFVQAYVVPVFIGIAARLLV